MKKKAQLDAKSKSKKLHVNDPWSVINPNAAGIDIGSRDHFACVPPDRAQQPIRSFKTRTEDLQALAAWLKECKIETVAMEATGVYWIPIYQILEQAGFKVVLANARYTKNVSGRKSDVLDCEWIQQLHTFGLLSGSFRPADPVIKVRSLTRCQDELIDERSKQILLMQKALKQMNIQLSEVVSDISGASGLAIISAILGGERNVLKLAALADVRIKSTQSDIAKALVGDYREELIFQLKIAFELFHILDAKIAETKTEIGKAIAALPDRHQDKPLPPKTTPKKKIDGAERYQLFTKLGVDVTAIEGIGITTGYTFLSEVGPDLSAFPNEKHFASWLCLPPNNKISGGKVLRSKTKKNPSRLAAALRMSATTLRRSQTALGACYRRLLARQGPAKAATSMAHRYARILYRLVKNGEAYVQHGMKEFEEKHQRRTLDRLQQMAKSCGYQVIPMQPVPTGVS